jgi:hypothetical protein
MRRRLVASSVGRGVQMRSRAGGGGGMENVAE